MEKETFAPWELEYAAELHAAQPVKEETVPAPAAQKTDAELLLTRAGWHKYWRTVVVKDSDARKLSKYWNTGNTKHLFSENQTVATRQTRRQWEEHGRRVIVDDSKAEIVRSLRDSTHTVHTYAVEQTEVIESTKPPAAH
jgi:hypothetical protein